MAVCREANTMPSNQRPSHNLGKADRVVIRDWRIKRHHTEAKIYIQTQTVLTIDQRKKAISFVLLAPAAINFITIVSFFVCTFFCYFYAGFLCGWLCFTAHRRFEESWGGQRGNNNTPNTLEHVPRCRLPRLRSFVSHCENERIGYPGLTIPATSIIPYFMNSHLINNQRKHELKTMENNNNKNSYAKRV